MPEATPAHTAQTLTPQQAAAEIVALINASPRSLWPDEIEAIVAKLGTAPALALGVDDAALLDKVRKAIVHLACEERRSIELDENEAAREAHLPVYHAAWRALEAAEAEIPIPPRSPVHVLLLAEIAHYTAEKDTAGNLTAPDRDDCFERPAAKLVESVLAYFGGVRP